MKTTQVANLGRVLPHKLETNVVLSCGVCGESHEHEPKQ